MLVSHVESVFLGLGGHFVIDVYVGGCRLGAAVVQ